MERQKRSRRSVLRSGTALLAAGGAASVSGCLGGVPFAGGGSVTPRKWLPEAGTFGDQDHGYFQYRKLKQILKHEDELGSDSEENLNWEGTRHDVTDVDPDEIAVALDFGGGTVWKADYEKKDVVDELEDNDFEEEDDYGGYTLYVGDSGTEYENMGVAVSGNKLVFNNQYGSDDPQDDLETVIDVSRGDEDRYVDESDPMKTLLNNLNTTDWLVGSTQEPPDETSEADGQFEGNTAIGGQASVNGDTTKLKYVLVFEESDQADKGDVEDWVENQLEQDASTWTDMDDVSVNKGGKTIAIKAKIDTDDFTF